VSTPLPCSFDVIELQPPEGQSLDYSKVHIAFDAEGAETTTFIGQVPDEAACPADEPAWFYDSLTMPTAIELCQSTCDLVSQAAQGSRVSVVVGCQDTVTIAR
jgi:hypothetical protein